MLKALSVLGGSWLAISRVIGRISIVVITHMKGPLTRHITAHEPSSRDDLHLLETIG